jgi:hypothetical protein
VIASIDVAPLGTGFNGYKMRMRKPVIEPGGVGALAHWWKNNMRRRTVFISADILAPTMRSEEACNLDAHASE